jgi:nicotinate phosphoribosyltransferase
MGRIYNLENEKDFEELANHRCIQCATDQDLYKITMCCAYFYNYPRAMGEYEMVIRSDVKFPKNFAKLVRANLHNNMQDLMFKNNELLFLKSRSPYIPFQFTDKFLRGFLYDIDNWVVLDQDEEGHLICALKSIDELHWAYMCELVLLEVQVMATISELYYLATGQADVDYDEFYQRTYEKGRRLLDAGCKFADFGVRRRLSFKAEETAVRALKQAQIDYERKGGKEGRFVGTSNVFLAERYNLKPIGTMAHEWICFHAAIKGGPNEANFDALEAWSKTYGGDLGIFLFDTFGWEAFDECFSLDQAMKYAGGRIDSGDNYDTFELLVHKYESFRINPKTKQYVFSNALTTDEAIDIQKNLRGQGEISFGIGTHFVNDFPGVKPLNFVIKLLRAKLTERKKYFNETCKLSIDEGKATGDPLTVALYRHLLHQTKLRYMDGHLVPCPTTVSVK